ncbi:39S ribosomal protein L21, mitochondrial isoform X2 [Rissa tridactyla]|uniref:39S ribosomal protein L21, mitochondrial isoform X2 n=1 Tax=Rissa tridactyla TaxID=75485 RepID=UPI0023BAEDB1|nr:39S ribosomal protein L21, mitochondrial isoform X2 [Rissa tridactyla]
MAAAVAAAARRQVTALFLSSAVRHQSSQSTSLQQGLVAKTSLTSPPWPEVKLPDPVEEAKYHTEVVQKVNKMIATGQYGRLFAVVHFASKQWKITSEDLIMMDNVLEAECGDRIRMEKVLLVGADDFTLIGRPLLGPVAFESITSKPSSSAPADSNHCHGARTEQQHPLLRKDLVRVEATVIEKTESWPKINMRFWRRHNYQRKKIIVNPQTVLRINTIEIFPCLS